jgi:TonB family protein
MVAAAVQAQTESMSLARHTTDRTVVRSRATGCGPTAKARGARALTQMPWIVLLTRDTELGESIRQAMNESAVADGNQASHVAVVDTVEQAEAFASTGRCAVLITDESRTHGECVQLGERVRRHEPAMVTIVVGDRGQDNALMGLLSTGVADRLMLKPVTPTLSRIVIESAAREFYARRARMAVERRITSPTARSARVDESDLTQPAQVRRPAEQAASIERFPQPTKQVGTVAPVAAQPGKWGRMIAWSILGVTLIAAGLVWRIAMQLAAPPAVAVEVEKAQSADLPQYRWLVDAGRAIDEARFVDAITALQAARRDGAPDDRIDAVEARLREALEVRLASAVPEADKSSPSPESAQPVDRVERPRSHNASPPDRVPVSSKPMGVSVAKTAEAILERNASSLVPMTDPIPAPSLQNSEQPADTALVTQSSEVAESRPSAAPTPSLAREESLEGPVVPASVQSTPAERRLVRMVEPEYPNEAYMRAIEGWTDLSFQISAAGDVVDPRVEDSSRKQLFARPALGAVKQWKYEPASEGSAERVQVRIEFRVGN